MLLRLGHAFALNVNWDQSRQTHEALLQRFPKSVFRHEARYGVAWAWQNQKQFDNAVAAYQQIVNETAAEIAAKSQYQLALCRLEQKRLPEAANALLVVPFTYDYPEWSAVALIDNNSPAAPINMMSELPPYEMKGSVRPLVGTAPIATAMLVTAWKAMSETTPRPR